MIVRSPPSTRRNLLGGFAGALFASVGQPASAQSGAETPILRVLTSGGLAAALQRLVPAYERAAQVRVTIAYGPSMGATSDAIPNRLDRGDRADVVILAREGLDRLIVNGKVRADTCRDIARSEIAVAVRAGAPIPDISTMEAFRRALVAAKSVAWSDSASGVYLATVLFPRLGLADAMKIKGREIPATPVGRIVAEGKAELGFQQMSELKPVPGITIVGLIPAQAQRVTVFSAGAVDKSSQTQLARAFITYLVSPQAASAIRETGMEPAGSVR